MFLILTEFLGAKAPLGLVSVSKSVTNKKVGNFQISQDFHEKDVHMS